MYGDRRPFPVAIVTLDPEEIVPWAKEQRSTRGHVRAGRGPEVNDLIQRVLDEANAKYAQVEQIKKFKILDHDLTLEAGELTPTLKVKRNVVYETLRRGVRRSCTRSRSGSRRWTASFGVIEAPIDSLAVGPLDAPGAPRRCARLPARESPRAWSGSRPEGRARQLSEQERRAEDGEVGGLVLKNRAGAGHEHPEADHRHVRYRDGSAPPRSAATDPAPARSRGRGPNRCSHPFAGRRCRCGPAPGSGPGEPARSVSTRWRRSSLGAIPGVELLQVGESGGPVQLGAAVRVVGKRVHSQRCEREEKAVAGSEQRPDRDVAHRIAPAGSSGSTTSVKRMSSGSSMVTCFTVCRTPR